MQVFVVEKWDPLIRTETRWIVYIFRPKFRGNRCFGQITNEA